MKLTYKKYGDKGILVQWPADVKLNVLDEMQAFVSCIKKTYSDVSVVYHAYHEVYIEFINIVTEFDAYKMQLQFAYAGLTMWDKKKINNWIVPVCYDTKLVSDLGIYLKNKKLDLDEFIDQHTSSLYTVYFTGFLPGFLYLGGLAESLAIDRKQTPSKKIAKGTVAIGGSQTGIYPQDSPGGWYGVGYTPISFFDQHNSKNPTWARSGDTIQFKAIDKMKLEALEHDISHGQFTFKTATDEG